MKKLLLAALALLFTLPVEAVPLQIPLTNPAPSNVQKIDNWKGEGWRHDRGWRRDNRRHWREERRWRRHMRREARRNCYYGECYGRRYNNYGNYYGQNYGNYYGQRRYRQNGGTIILQF